MDHRNAIRLSSQVLAQVDHQLAAREIKPAFGVVVVEQLPPPRLMGGVLLLESEARCDIHVVLAAHKSTGFVPGQYVAVNWEAGMLMKNFRAGKYRAAQNVRILGRERVLQEPRAQTSGQRRSRNLTKLRAQIFGTIRVNMYKINVIQPGEQLAISHRTSMDTYESFVKTPLVGAYEDGETVNIVVGDVDGKCLTSVAIPTGRCLRVTVKRGLGILQDVRIEQVAYGNQYEQEYAFSVDQENPIIPYRDRSVVEMGDLRDKSAGGIHLPDDHASRDCTATVIAKGSDCSEDYNVGDKVIIRPSYIEHDRDIAMFGMGNRSLKCIDDDGVQCVLVTASVEAQIEADRGAA